MTLCSSWIDETDLCAPCGGEYLLDSGLMENFIDVSSELLYMLSGQQFPGLCETTIRPCTSRAWFDYSGSGLNIPGRSYPLDVVCGCNAPETCGCGNLSQIALLNYPVTEVTEVKVDGVVLPDSSYRLDEGHFLVRLDSERWPCCQDLALADTEPDTFSVEYSHGRPVPLPLQNAAAVLACELYMGCNPESFEGQCRLPRNVVSIVRQGVSIAMKSAFFTKQPGKSVEFGIPEIDMALAAYNPYGLTAPMVILSADEPDLARRVGA